MINKEKEAHLSAALENVEITWKAVELAITTAQQAADEAYKACFDVRGAWRREEGTDILRLLEMANTVSIHAKYRADNAARINSYDAQQIESGIKQFRAIEAAHGIKETP